MGGIELGGGRPVGGIELGGGRPVGGIELGGGRLVGGIETGGVETSALGGGVCPQVGRLPAGLTDDCVK